MVIPALLAGLEYPDGDPRSGESIRVCGSSVGRAVSKRDGSEVRFLLTIAD